MDGVQHSDAFEIFRLPRKYQIELKAIEQTYWKLQKRLHPDLFGSKSHYEQQLSATNSALVNDAYWSLKDPIRRIDILLKLHGINALDETSGTNVDPALLMETMEIRENIASASLHKLQKLKTQVGNDIHSIVQRLHQTYDIEGDLQATQKLVLKLQYLRKSMQEMAKKEEKLQG